jgi:TRAP-type mannitol/chloroaromatic compound transport system substrate-binding protein
MTGADAHYYFGKDSAFTLSASVPFGPNAWQSNAW